MNTAILGSSFDPPHNGHLAIARCLLKSQIIQKVILMPARIHPFAKKMSISRHRLEMAKLLANELYKRHSGERSDSRIPSGNKRFWTSQNDERDIEVSDLELRKQSTSYSIDTLKTLQKQSPSDHFFWIIGSDNIKDFKKWKNWREIIEKFGLIIVSRHIRSPRRSPFGHLRGGKLIWLHFIPINISSTEVRKRVKEGKSITVLVPEKIEEYIIQKKLYL
ncbi:MAG: nicotinate (nicotinamide) nucleotide adenylyltransferase [Candidatus Levybacteria bacterium]|nr:nicotinate (nicotinamide) nucleotide adenylyltransferase [Candidatus Levybacteria bacterium]